jgi:WD40 repeat protein
MGVAPTPEILDDVRVGIAHHLGWAVAVAASADQEAVDRRRIELVEPGVPAAPIHHDAKPLDDEATAALVARVRASALRAASVGAATLHPDGTVLAGVGNDRVVRLWDVASRRQLTTWTPPTSDNISDLTFSPDRGILAVGGGGDRASAVWLFDVTSGRLAATLAPGNHWGCSIAFSPDGRYLVTVSYDTADSGIAQVWDLRSRRPVATLTGVSTAAFSPDGKTLATGDRAGTIRLWTVRRPPA